MATLSANSRKNSSVSATASSGKSNGTETQRNDTCSPEDVRAVANLLPSSSVVLHQSVKADMADEIDHMSQVEQYSTHEIEFGMVPSYDKKDKSRVEHNDSGFSDRSISSNGYRPYTNVESSSEIVSIGADETIIETEEKVDAKQRDSNSSKQIGAKLSVNMLKQKLEKMAEACQETRPTSSTNTKKLIQKLSSPHFIDSKELDEEMSYTTGRRQSTRSPSPVESDMKLASPKHQLNNVGRPKNVLIRSASMQHKRIVEKEPIMRSDFTNTVKMRKKSLECNAQREKIAHSPRIILESSGKVSKLLQRFSSRNNSITSSSSDQIDEPTDDGTPQFSEKIQEQYVDGEPNGTIFKQDDEVFETLNTPLAAQSFPSIEMEPNDFPSKPADDSNRKRIITTRRELINIESSIHKMDTKVHSPTKLTNSSMCINERLPKQSKTVNSNKKFQKSTTAETTKQSVTAAASMQRPGKNTPAIRATAYASFNRTSPIRLSGRVKEVTVSRPDYAR